MRTVRTAVLVLTSAVVILACDVSSLPLPNLSSTATFVPPPPAATDTPVLAPTATPTPVVAEPSPTFTAIPPIGSPEVMGRSVDYRNLRFVIPDGLSTDTTSSYVTDVELPYINPSNGPMPEHIKVMINGYPIQGATLQPQVHVFPVSLYAKYSDLTQQMMSTLENSQFLDGQPLPAGLPEGPFDAHVASVEFANGRGIRYLTQFDEAALPANNREMIYYFQGITLKADYYVQVILPVQAPFLAANGDPNSPVPAGGIPFNMDDLGAYFQAVSDKLNATPPDQFNPPLAVLDALVRSIAVK